MQINCPACKQSIIVPPLPAVAPPDDSAFKIKTAALRKWAIIGAGALLLVGIVFAVFTFMLPTVLKGSQHLDTPQSYRPPVEITVVAKTDSTNLRLAYEADQ